MRSNSRAKTAANVFGDYLTTPESHENMIVFPVFTSSPQCNGYALLDEAIKSSWFTEGKASNGLPSWTPSIETQRDRETPVYNDLEPLPRYLYVRRDRKTCQKMSLFCGAGWT